MTVSGAPIDYGIKFVRADCPSDTATIDATWDQVELSPLCTKLVNDHGISVKTVEHLLASLAGCGITNARITVDGPELPILDGSARPFALEFVRNGLIQQDGPLKAIRILTDVVYSVGNAWAKLTPSDTPWMSFHIAFDEKVIGVQEKSLCLSNGSFVRELCDSRTFCSNKDVEAMWAKGLALGGTLENAVVVDGDEVLSPGGLRHKDEAVRHKMLDALGDLCLAGAPIIGHYVGHCAGHAVTNGLLRALFADPSAFEYVGVDAEMNAILPGVNIGVDEFSLVA
jgi:UDP-3-O-[3-hydroxymyristoyl] N-acetylglucosamine deacetylase